MPQRLGHAFPLHGRGKLTPENEQNTLSEWTELPNYIFTQLYFSSLMNCIKKVEYGLGLGTVFASGEASPLALNPRFSFLLSQTRKVQKLTNNFKP